MNTRDFVWSIRREAAEAEWLELMLQVLEAGGLR
jgi:hypothetical protein